MTKLSSLLKIGFGKKKIALIVVLILVVILIGFFLKNRNNEPSESVLVKKGDLIEELILSGEIDATEMTNLFFPVSGKISWISVKEGDTVKKSQSLATLDQASVVKNFQSALLDYSKQRNNFEDTKDDNGSATPQTAPSSEVRRILENNQYDLDKSVIAVELKDIAKRDSVIFSPFEGIITSKSNYFVGNNIAFGTTLFQIVNPSTIYFSVLADQTEVVNLEVGQKCEITLDSFEDRKIKGKIEQISFTPDAEESGTSYRVTVSIDSEVSDFRIGMSGDASFITDEIESALFLPSKFIKSDEDGDYVLLGEKKEKTYIKIGLETDENTQIQSGLKEGDLVYD
ncbi:MAG: efflux RND transporter periplasmic adaptor subunit [Candidatus Levybacteria bacterium]|nr:efflux RND transporter periplasmic adaptor subunit [Candidatus Levybacteria bacterium]